MSQRSQRSQRSVTPLLLGTFLLRLGSGASSIILGLFLAQLALHTGHTITSLQVGLLSVAFYIVELSLAPFMGALSDHRGRRPFLIIGPLAGVVHVILIFFTPVAYALPYLLSLEVIAGLSSAMTTPAILGYLADITVKDQVRRTRTMSLFELVTSGGIAVGVVLGGFTWEHFERFSFFLLGALYVIVALCMLLAPQAQQIVERGTVRVLAKRYWQLIRAPRLFIFIPAWISINALVGVWFSSQITFILSRPTNDPEQLLMGSMSGHNGGHYLSLVLGSYVLFFGLSLLFWAFFLSRVPRLRLMLTSIAGVYLACLALAGMNHRGAGNDWLFFVWIPVLAVGIFSEASFAPAALSYLADISEEAARDRGLLMGLYSIFLGVGQLLGNGLGGLFARNWGFDGLIYLTALLAFVALVSLLMLFRVEKKRFDIDEKPESLPLTMLE